ncbi:MAG: restriction endonuclease subunit S [Paludibacteraceae bacterium]|nr:restriction endonuclease subunit S [Paludibacteraceae bacterium]
MGLKKYKLGDLISLCDERNSDNRYTLSDVKGISIKKEFIETKADMAGVSLSPYILVRPDSFAYVTVTSRNGEKITLAHNISEDTYVVSSSYIVFKVDRPDIILSDYLFMFFNRPEFDRYSRFNSWGSARETFSWEDFCDIDITLPSIDQQRKYVDVYLALQNNLAAYQSKVEELKLVCDGYLDKLKVENQKLKIGEFIEVCDERNSEGIYTLKNLRGVSIEKKFIDTKADMAGVSLAPYIVVKPDYFVFVPVTSRNGEKITLAINDSKDTYIVSSAYTVFRVKDTKSLLPEYLFMYFNRPEFDRYARFNSWGSAREVFTMDDMNDVAIPIPDISIQREIVNIHKCYIERQRIAEALKELLKNICPVLIRGSLTE